MAAAHYPGAVHLGDEIPCLQDTMHNDVRVCHASSADKDGNIVTNGGRVPCVTALGDNITIAAERACQVADQITFNGAQFRRDIGWRALGRK